MRFIIYTLNGCKACQEREDIHNQIAMMLEGMGVETLGITYGHVNGSNYYPYEEHDKLCRKPGDASNYTAPVYILEDESNVVKLPDLSQYPQPRQYADYIGSVVQQLD